jgi:hypothetical protein
MARFGEKWTNHEETIAANWRDVISPTDVVLIPGDVSWASAPNKVLPDLEWLQPLPGHKILLRGNHDHWWSNIDRARKIAEPLGFQLLEGDSVTRAGVVVCGAMGHIAPEDPYYKPDPPKNRYERELHRLEKALQHGTTRRQAGQPMILIMHYPPFTSEGKPTAYSQLIAQYKPDVCLYGHLHRSREWTVAVNGDYEGTQYRLVAADFVEMKPQLIWKSEG